MTENLQETYVLRRGIVRRKNTFLLELAFFTFLVIAGIDGYFHWNIHTGLKAFNQERYPDCIRHLNRAGFFAPLDRGLYYKIALAHSRLGHAQEVVDLCNRILAMPKPELPFQFSSGIPSPSLNELYLGLAMAYLSLQQYNEAIIYSQLMIAQDRNDAWGYKILATAQMQKSVMHNDQKGMKAAMDFYEKARELNSQILTPEDQRAYAELKAKLGTRHSLFEK